MLPVCKRRLDGILPASIYTSLRFALELELLQTQMTQKPMLWGKVYSHVMRASHYRK